MTVTYRVLLLLDALKVDEWADPSLLDEELLKQEGMRVKKAIEAKSRMTKSVNIISSKRKDYIPLRSYYSALSKYYKTKEFLGSFIEAFDLRKENALSVHQGIKLSRVGALHYGQQLDKMVLSKEHPAKNSSGEDEDATYDDR
ncbi:hypothetical protein BJV82DRAFT_598061 [Fennellomyces sp. T-0311]|nr:hypothetical protein BJV82DRAFT_598061 [Fennellomyces sp. T-0311]